MSRRILFSPIGGTDPIRYFHDGSMLHICRYYKPDLVYLYMSHEMLENHRADNRYVATLQMLGKHLEHSFEVEVIERGELTEVQEYDIFYKDFREIIINIEDGMNEGDELILNIASGTPAMKSALLILATLAEYKYIPIQVSTPQKKINSEYENRDLTIEEIWQSNIDNQEKAENRCKEIKCLNLMTLLKIDMIKKHIRVYDYAAAFSIAEEIKNDISSAAYLLLKVANERIKLNIKEVDRLLRGKGYNIFPIPEITKNQKILEYALVLQIKVAKEEYADFVRGITPIVIDLFEIILNKHCGIKLSDYTNQDKNKTTIRWNESKLIKDGLMSILDKGFNGRFNGGIVYSTHITCLIRSKSNKRELIRNVDGIRDVEEKMRNEAAHEIVSVTAAKIKAKTGKSVNEIMGMIKYLIGMAGIKNDEAVWKSYDYLNELIEKEFEKQKYV